MYKLFYPLKIWAFSVFVFVNTISLSCRNQVKCYVVLIFYHIKVHKQRGRLWMFLALTHSTKGKIPFSVIPNFSISFIVLVLEMVQKDCDLDNE